MSTIVSIIIGIAIGYFFKPQIAKLFKKNGDKYGDED